MRRRRRRRRCCRLCFWIAVFIAIYEQNSLAVVLHHSTNTRLSGCLIRREEIRLRYFTVFMSMAVALYNNRERIFRVVAELVPILTLSDHPKLGWNSDLYTFVRNLRWRASRRSRLEVICFPRAGIAQLGTMQTTPFVKRIPNILEKSTKNKRTTSRKHWQWYWKWIMGALLRFFSTLNNWSTQHE